MYENSQPDLERILALVKSCPQELQAKCFEVLLGGYVESQVPKRAAAADSGKLADTRQEPPAGGGEGDTTDIPPEIRARFNSLATRSKVKAERLADLFDFSVDPFTFGAFAITGKNNYEKARKIALLVAAKGYLVTGKWSADWDEVKAVCNDHGCYDVGNFAKTMREAKGTLFKVVNVGEFVELNTKGVGEAHALIEKMLTDAAK